jgi:hypothetical protein
MSYRLVTVLVPRPFAQREIDLVLSFIRNLADFSAGNSFHVAGQAFDYDLVDLDDEDEEDLRRVVIRGWHVRGALRLVARTGGTTSQVLLGVVATRLAQMLDGWIALDGQMELMTDNPAVLTFDGVNGRLRTEAGFDVISPAVMGFWLGGEGFSLI